MNNQTTTKAATADTTWAECYKLFMAVIYEFSKKARELVPGRPFQPCLMVLGKVRAYPRMKHLKGASLGQTPALFVNIRLDLKDLPVTNTLAYYENS